MLGKKYFDLIVQVIDIYVRILSIETLGFCVYFRKKRYNKDCYKGESGDRILSQIVGVFKRIRIGVKIKIKIWVDGIKKRKLFVNYL